MVTRALSLTLHPAEGELQRLNAAVASVVARVAWVPGRGKGLAVETLRRRGSPLAMSPPPAHPIDLRLVRQVLEGDEGARAAFIERMARVPRLVREGHRRMGGSLDVHELEDVVQETLAAIWTKLSTFEGRASLETWAYRFGRNELLKAFDKKRRHHGRVEADAELLGQDENEEEASPIEARTLHEKLEALDPISATIVRDRHFEERSFQEIASARQEPLGTVKTRYYRAIDRLRQSLAPHWTRGGKAKP